jgi:hypothetical protein
VPDAQSGTALPGGLGPLQQVSAVVAPLLRVVVQVVLPLTQVVDVPPPPTLPLQQLPLTWVALIWQVIENVFEPEEKVICDGLVGSASV